MNNYMRDRAAPEISSKITAQNGKVNWQREIEKPDRGSWTKWKDRKNEFQSGEMRDLRKEVWNKMKKYSGWCQGKRLARQSEAVTRIDMRDKEPVRCWYREKKSNVFVLKMTLLQVAAKVIQFTGLLKVGKMFLYPGVCQPYLSSALLLCLFISLTVILSIALLSLLHIGIDITGEKLWCNQAAGDIDPNHVRGFVLLRQ